MRLRTSVSKSFGSIRTTRSFFKTPQHIWPASMNVRPPSIFFSSTSVRSARATRHALRELLVVRHIALHSLAGSPNTSNRSGRTKPCNRAIRSP
jgi:hypothetical protein